jgi:hypothetical protein
MTKRLKRRCGNGWDNSQTTSMLGFRRTGKGLREVYQCWWRSSQEINFLFFPQVLVSAFYVLYPFVTYLLTLPRTKALSGFLRIIT